MTMRLQIANKATQSMSMNQQLGQAIALMQYSTQELLQLIKQHQANNPLLDIPDEEEFPTADIPYYPTATIQYTQRERYLENDQINNISAQKTLREFMLEQTLLCRFKSEEQIAAEAIIDAINDDGQLTMSLEEIRHCLGCKSMVSMHCLERVLAIIQGFEPAGVGYRDTTECLSIQLKVNHPDFPYLDAALKILALKEEMPQLFQEKKPWLNLGLAKNAYEETIELICSLTLKPLMNFDNPYDPSSYPELYVKNIRDHWQVHLVESILTRLSINQSYKASLAALKKHPSHAALQQELTAAQWLIKSLNRRNETMLRVSQYIINYQQEFLSSGKSALKPLNIAQVADDLELHQSTISRITTGKYIATPQGIFELKYFFPSGVASFEGGCYSDIAIKEVIKKIIADETSDRIYSDTAIMEYLAQNGITIARRTVAKYREALNILPSHQRRIVKNHGSGTTTK